MNGDKLTAPSKSACISVDKPTLLPVMLLLAGAGGSFRFGSSSLVPFLTKEERNSKESFFLLQVKKAFNLTFTPDY